MPFLGVLVSKVPLNSKLRFGLNSRPSQSFFIRFFYIMTHPGRTLEGWELGTRNSINQLGSAMVACCCGLSNPGNLVIGTPGHHDPGVRFALVPLFSGLRFCTSSPKVPSFPKFLPFPSRDSGSTPDRASFFLPSSMRDGTWGRQSFSILVWGFDLFFAAVSFRS